MSGEWTETRNPGFVQHSFKSGIVVVVIHKSTKGSKFKDWGFYWATHVPNNERLRGYGKNSRLLRIHGSNSETEAKSIALDLASGLIGECVYRHRVVLEDMEESLNGLTP